MAKGNDTDRYVQPNALRGGWDIVKDDRGRVSAHVATKAEAVKRARAIVKNLGGGEIRIRGNDGRMADSITISGPKHQESKAKDGAGRATGRAAKAAPKPKAAVKASAPARSKAAAKPKAAAKAKAAAKPKAAPKKVAAATRAKKR